MASVASSAPGVGAGSVATCHSLRAAGSAAGSAAAASVSKPTATSAALAAASLSLSPAMRSVFSGAVAGVVADSVLHPLDVINLRMKVQREPSARYASIARSVRTILKEEGVRGYFAGLGTTLMCSPVCAAVYFGSYETLKAAAVPLVAERNAGLVYFMAGAASELLISAISVPSEVIKSRLQLGRNPRNASGGAVKYTSNYRSTLHAASSILRSEGLSGLYAGYSACVSVDTFFSAFSFLFYESLKTRYRERLSESRPLSTVESLALGSVAGGCAAFLTNPLDVITVRLMTQGKHKTYRGLRHCLVDAVQREGVMSLMKGATCRTAAVMPTTGLCFGVYETIKLALFDGDLDDFDLDDLS